MYHTPFYPDNYYHVYNRGNNRQTVFFEPRNYHFFLDRLKRYISPQADIYSFCLLPNHFHLLLKPKQTPKMRNWTRLQPRPWNPCQIRNPLSQAFANLINSYTKAIHKDRESSGALFQKRLQRIPVYGQEHLNTIYHYIENNAVRHQLTEHPLEWEFGSPLFRLSDDNFLTNFEKFTPERPVDTFPTLLLNGLLIENETDVYL